MRISQVASVTGVPLPTLKDLRHRSILELAGSGWLDDDDETRRWGSFSVPSVMVIKGAAEVRETYGLAWKDAIEFTKCALNSIMFIFGGQNIKFFDLRAVPHEVWAWRFDFGNPDPVMTGDWNYTSGQITALGESLSAMKTAREVAYVRAQKGPSPTLPETTEPKMCLMLNASRLCRETWYKVQNTNDAEGDEA